MAQANAKGGVVRPRSALGGNPQAWPMEWGETDCNCAVRPVGAVRGAGWPMEWGETDCNWPLEKAG